MRYLALACVLLFMLSCPCLAEENARDMLSQADIGKIQSFADQNALNVDIDHITDDAVQGKIPDLDEIVAFFKNALRMPLKSAAERFAGVIVPMLLLAVLGSAFPDAGGGTGGAAFILNISLLGKLSDIVLQALSAAQNCMAVAKSFSDMIAPVLTALITAAGMNSSAALVTPTSALAGNLIENLFSTYGVSACRYALVLAVAGSLSAAVDLSSVVGMIRKSVNWCCGLAGTLFAALISVQHNLAASLDSAAVKTAKYTVDSITSIIGSGVSDAWSTYISGVSIAKNAVGVSGAAAMLASGIKPLAEILFSMLAVNLVSVFLKIIGEKGAAKAAEQLSGVCQMALALSCSCVVIAVILVSALMFTGRGLLY